MSKSDENEREQIAQDIRKGSSERSVEIRAMCLEIWNQYRKRVD